MFVLLGITLMFFNRNGVTDVNLALNKPVSYCGAPNVFTKLTDGSKHPDDAEIISETCKPYSYIEINLMASYFVHYVVIFEGPPLREGSNSGGLDYFVVDLRTSEMLSSQCSFFPRTSVGPRLGRGMRVNCITAYANLVKIKSRQGKGMSIAEAEVYTMASGVLEEPFMIPLGCVDTTSVTQTYPTNSPVHCCMQCTKMFDLCGIKKTDCFCMHILKNKDVVDSSRCNVECSGIACGGKGAHSIYLVKFHLPVNFGCAIVPLREKAIVDVTYYDCVSKCSDKRFATLTNGRECACTGSTPSVQPGENTDLCDVPCFDDAGLMCGGLKHSSIIKIGTKYEADICGRQFSINDCVTSCRTGYTGEYCVYGQENPDDEGMTSTTHVNKDMNCHTIIGSTECRCIVGYRKNNDNLCIDIDECSMDTCEKNSTRCVNFLGSYSCECMSGLERKTPTTCTLIKDGSVTSTSYIDKDMNCQVISGSTECRCIVGYGKNNDNLCIDIDECSMDTCEKITTRCVNSLGSFSCECRPGFERKTTTTCTLKGIEDDKPSRVDTKCQSVPGSKICTCPSGFSKHFKSHSCIDVDECKLNRCDERSSTCINNHGSYSCKCKEGYIASSTTYCKNIDVIGNTASKECLNESKAGECSCPLGYTKSPNGRFCNDLDECVSFPCEHECRNQMGSYICICDMDQSICHDSKKDVSPNSGTSRNVVLIIFVMVLVIFALLNVLLASVVAYRSRPVKNQMKTEEEAADDSWGVGMEIKAAGSAVGKDSAMISSLY